MSDKCEECKHKPTVETLASARRDMTVLRCYQCKHGMVYQDFFEPLEPVVLAERIRTSKCRSINNCQPIIKSLLERYAQSCFEDTTPGVF